MNAYLILLVRKLNYFALLLIVCTLLQSTCCLVAVLGQERLAPMQLPSLELSSDISTLRFSNDGTILAVSTSGKEINLWKINGNDVQPRPSLMLPEEPKGLCRLAFSLDGTSLAAADRNRVWAWKLQNGTIENSWQLTNANAVINELSYSTDTISIVDADGRILRLDPAKKELESAGTFFGSKVRAISSDGRFCVRISDGMRLFAWDLSQELLLPVNLPVCKFDEVVISNDGQTIAIAGLDWDGRTRDQGRSLDESPGASANEQKPAWGTIDGGIWTLSTETGEKQKLKEAGGKHIQRLQYSPDSSCLAAVLADSIDLIFGGKDDPSSPRNLTIPRPEAMSGKPIELALAPSWPPRVAVKSGGRKVDLWAWPEPTPPTMPDSVRSDIVGDFRNAFGLRKLASGVRSRIPEAAAPPSDAEITSEPSSPPEKKNAVYTVFYGTNRERRTSIPFWLDEAWSFARSDVGLLLAGVCAIALAVSLLNYAMLRALTFVRALRPILLIGFIYGGCLIAHILLVLRHDPSKPNEYFGNERGALKYGSVQVSIPLKHDPGILEVPTVFLTPDPKLHFVLQQVDPADGRVFLERLAEEANGQDAFIFIHGYNVSFEGAALRTAQMAHDLKFKGIPIFYSWPSKASIFGYVQDANNSDLAGVQLARFLSDVEKYSGARRVHLIAHSMGARVLANALREIGPKRLDGGCFREIILAAPDIDSDYFRFGIAPAIAFQSAENTGRRVTVYASNADRALLASKSVNGFARAGDATNLVVYPGIDTIDVSDLGDISDLTGHSYYGGLPDLFELLETSKPAGERRMLELRSDRELPYWKHRRPN